MIVAVLSMDDKVHDLAGQIAEAAEHAVPLMIRGGGTKDFYGEPFRPPQAEILDVSALAGIVCYDPDELMLTVRAGTTLREIEAVLAEKRQILPFEPPIFGENSTIGGAVSAGLAGPRRAHCGAVRDFVTGCRMIDGSGQLLNFGGRVVKNVAGYDVHKIMAGAMGTLGVLTELSLKVLPAPFAEESLILEKTEDEARRLCHELMSRPLPLSGTFWAAGRLHLRLSGTESGVRTAVRNIGGERLSEERAAAFWSDVRGQRLPSFALAEGERLWRVAVPDTADNLLLEGDVLVEWGGGLRWYKNRVPADEVRLAASRAGGHATLFRGALREGETVFTRLEGAASDVQQRLKKLFDPKGILNPQRLFPHD